MDQRPLPHPGDPHHRGRPIVARHLGADLQQFPTSTRVAIERLQQHLDAQHHLHYQQPPPPMQQQPLRIPPLPHQEQQQQVQGQLRHQEFEEQQPLSDQQPEEEEEEQQQPPQQQLPQQQPPQQQAPIADDGQEEEKKEPNEEEEDNKEEEEEQQKQTPTAVKAQVKQELEDDNDDDEVVVWSSEENTPSRYLKANYNFVSKIKVREAGVPENAPWDKIHLKAEMLSSLTHESFALEVIKKLREPTSTLNDYSIAMTYFDKDKELARIRDTNDLVDAILHQDNDTDLHLTVEITGKINVAPPTAALPAAAPAAAAAAAPADVAPAANAARLPAARDDSCGHVPSPSHQGHFLMETQARTVTPEDDSKKAAVEQSGKSGARKKPAIKPSGKPRTCKKPAVKEPEATTRASKKQRTNCVTIHGTPLAAKGDKDKLSVRMAFARKHCLVWHLASKSADVKEWNDCHNNKIVLNQVGIECAACRNIPHRDRKPFSLQFPSSDKVAIRKCISRFMRKHFYKCNHVKDDIKQEYAKLSIEGPCNGVSDHTFRTATECSLVFKKGGVFMK